MSTKTTRFDPAWEANIYSQKAHINRYPYGELVSFFFRALRFISGGQQDRSSVKVLELGSGAGNNLAFLCREGFDVSGVDGSQSACDISKDFLEQQGLRADIRCAEFASMPFDDGTFDVIVDREATCCGTLDDLIAAWREADRVLAPGGVVISFLYSDRHPDYFRAIREPDFAQKVEEYTFTDIQGGTFQNTGIAHFTPREQLAQIFPFLDIRLLNHHVTETVGGSAGLSFHYAEWVIVGVKK